jgi:hypothetical protein
MDRFSIQTRECMKSLLACHMLCLSTAMTRCLESDQPNRPQHFRLIADCAAACSFAADILAHKSQFHTQVCALCADICDTCAQDCESLGGLEDCASACRDAAVRCRDLAKLHHAEIVAMASRLPPDA